jgi:glycosyltransferase involved in cell wall biosynthesis
MPPFKNRIIDLTPWVRAPGSGVGITAWHSFQAIHRMDPSVQGACRMRGGRFHWIHPLERLMGRKGTLYHSFEHRMPPLMKGSRLLSIHDLWTLREGNAWQSAEFQKRQAPLLEQAIRRADWITTPSRAVLRQLHERFPETKIRSQVVHWGPTVSREAIKAAETLVRPIERPYFLTVASFEARKNLPFILESIRGMAGFDWVFAGRPGHGSDEVLKQIRDFESSTRVRFHFLQDLSAAELVNLYRHCEAVVLPSLDEGFGLPALEAASLSRPLILSNIEPFREIAIDAALYFDPVHGSEALRGHLLQLLEDPAQGRRLAAQASLRAQLFTWEKTGASFIEIYRKLESR